MGMFDIMKGAYLASGAVDKALPVATGNVVERGSILVIDGEKFRLCAAADADNTGATALAPYAALVATDKTAAMAGGALYTQAGNPMTPLSGSLPGGANPIGLSATDGLSVITAVPLSMEGEFRTSEFATTNGAPEVDDLLTYGANGKLVVAAAATDTIVGKVTKASTQTYHNYKLINGGTAQGGPVNVIEFVSFFVPKMA